jgi:galactose oxidase
MSHSSRVKSSLTLRVLPICVVLLLCLLSWLPMPAASNEGAAKKKVAYQNPGVYGRWENGFNTAPSVHLHVLPNGMVLTWTQLYTPAIQTFARLWDPNNPSQLPEVNYTQTDLFCSGHSFLPDGRLLVTGGTLPGGAYHYGTPKATIFDYRNISTNPWSNAGDMNNGRWYPTNLALGNGEALVLSGSYIDTSSETDDWAVNRVPQVWQTTGGWRNLPNAIYPYMSLYPWAHLLSNGKVFISGPDRRSLFMTTENSGTVCDGPQSNGHYRDSGSSVMYDVDKILIVGGENEPFGVGPTNTAEFIDLSAPGATDCNNPAPPVWQYTRAPMANKRRHLNTTVLPDGKVLVTGGTSKDGFNSPCSANWVLVPEMWNPDTHDWLPMAAMSYPRLYHSTAVLLPDARVLVAGTTIIPGSPCPGPCCQVENQQQTQIFSPPYLYTATGEDAARPAIINAPQEVDYGQTYTLRVQSGDLAEINSATLIRLPSVTHSFNQNQRINKLAVQSQSSTRFSITIPSNPNACPPGHYMLFILNSNGVPSKAKIIRVRPQGEGRLSARR